MPWASLYRASYKYNLSYNTVAMAMAMAMAIGIFGVKASVPPFLPTLFYSTGGALATVRIDVQNVL